MSIPWKKIFGFGAEVTADAAIISGIPALFKWLKNTHDNLPPETQKKIPGFLGLSLADEQIFWGLVGQLTPKEQVIIMSFLSQCKDYERNRFINIVAGMEVVEKGSSTDKKESFDDNGKKVIETKTSSKEKTDKRQEFLSSFAKVISQEFNGDFGKAYTYCVAGRMLVPNPLHQKVLRCFSEGAAWFKNTILTPSGTTSAIGLQQKVSANSVNLSQATQSFEDRGRAFYEKSKKKK